VEGTINFYTGSFKVYFIEPLSHRDGSLSMDFGRLVFEMACTDHRLIVDRLPAWAGVLRACFHGKNRGTCQNYLAGTHRGRIIPHSMSVQRESLNKWMIVSE
jgi:hypothetical protein